jgi:hypothetical protein
MYIAGVCKAATDKEINLYRFVIIYVAYVAVV